MFVRALTLLTLVFTPVVLAQSFLEGLQQTLNAAGLTQLVNVTSVLNGTSAGQSVLSQLGSGKKSLFAPTNEAFSVVDPALLSNDTVLADIFAYHVITGNFVNNTQSFFPNVTIGRTLLNDPTFVSLEGNKSQVLTWTRADNGSLFVQEQQQMGNAFITNSTSFSNTDIFAIDAVLTPPPNASAIFNNASYDITNASTILQSTSVPGGSSFYDELLSARGFTAFVPNNEALQAAQGNLSGIFSNTTALQNVLENHIINGTSVYSTLMPTKQYVSAGGQPYSFINNATGLFVSVAGSNMVEVVQRNVLTSNGVIHIVNGVMVATSDNLAEASSAFVSATSVAAQQTTETGPVGSAMTGTPTSSPTPTSGASALKGLSNSQLGGLVGTVLLFGRMV